MIAFVKGILEMVTENGIIVENQGVGFEIIVPGSVLSSLPPAGREIKIYTYTYVREDALQLYGFLTRDEMNMFKLLITVSGIGPKGALGILSVMDVDTLRFAILAGDSKAIAKAPGIGAKTAAKLILELKDKCNIEDMLAQGASKISRAEGAGSSLNANAIQAEAVEALVALGYSATEATSAVRGIDVTEEMTVEEVLKQSLKNL